jgi:hypothetical protein
MRLLASSWPSVCMEQLGSHWTDFHEIWYLSFSKICRESSRFINLTRITAILHADQYTFLIISRSFLIRMRNVSDKSRRENRNTHFMFSNILFENLAVYDIMWKKSVEPKRPQIKKIRRIRIACSIPKATNTHSLCNTYCFFHCNNGCTNAPNFYVIRALPVLFCLI